MSVDVGIDVHRKRSQVAVIGQAITRRRGTKIATTAIARKLLTRACHLPTDAGITAPQAPARGAPTDREGPANPGQARVLA